MSLARRDGRREALPLVRTAGPLLVLAGAMLLLPVGDVRPSVVHPAAFGMLGGAIAVLDQLVGEALLVVGALAWMVGLRPRIGLLAVLAGIAWFGPDLFARVDADPLLRASGRFLLAPMLWPLLLHLGLATLGVDGQRPVAGVLALVYAVSAVVAVGTAIRFDPAFDLWCGDLGCQFQNPFLAEPRVVGAIRRWRAIGAVLLGGVAALTVAMPAAWLGARLDRDLTRRAVAWALIAVGLAGMGRAALLIVDPSEDLGSEAWRWSWGVVAATVLLLALTVGTRGAVEWRRAARIRRFGATLDAAPAPGTLEGVLRAGLGDLGLRLGYWLERGVVVDASGVPWAGADAATAASAQVTPIERDGVRLAMLEHAASVDPGALAAAFTPTVLVALDNERLRAARLAQLRELRASRARIVAAGDAERRRLERDLHDGVQQQLLSLLFDVRLARLAATRAGDEAEATRLARAEERAQAAVDELRRIAHGIHPAVLTRSGLGPALVSLAEEAPLPVEVAADGVGRLPEAVEAAAYQAVAEMVADAARDGAGGVEVRAARDGATLWLEVRRDRAVGAGGVPVRIADRVGAAGGEAAVEALPTGGTLLRVELPCA